MSSPPIRMATRRLGSLLLIYHGLEVPSDQEWGAFLGQLRPMVATARLLVVTHGGGPNAAQRARLSRVTSKHPIETAVVSDSIPVRFIASCIALFMSRIRCYGLGDVEAAYQHLHLDGAERQLAERHLAELRLLVMGASPRAEPPGGSSP